MRLFLKVLAVMALPILVVASLLIFGPREIVGEVPRFEVELTSANVEDYLAKQEARFDDIVLGVNKQIVWHDNRISKTPYALVYIHGFSASLQEIRPVPDLVARELGANLFFTRLKGHGRSGEAMGQVYADDWLKDVAEAIAVGRALGDKVIVMGTSTGGALASLATIDDALSQNLEAAIFVAPNFGVQASEAELLTLPFARLWGPLLAGSTRESPQPSEEAAKYWTTSYPTEAIVPLMVLTTHVQELDYSKADVPALFYFSKKDKVVRPEATQIIAETWGAQKRIVHPELTAQDDASAHVIAGELRGPNQTRPAVAVMVEWLASVGISGEPSIAN